MPATPTDIHLPASIPVLPGTALSARYLLTTTAPPDRGDTVDAFALPDGSTGLLAADVVGDGFAAAIAATQVRTVVRERLLAGDEVADVVRALHRLADHLPDLHGTTVAVGLLEPTGAFSYALAGHPFPVVWAPVTGARVLRLARGRPLGAGGPVRGGHTVVPADGGLLLHTDGLCDAVHGPRPVAVLDRALREDVAALPGSSVHDLLDVLAERLLGTGAARVDDAAVLLVRRTVAPRPLVVDLPAIASSLERAEDLLGAWLVEVGAGLPDQVALQHVLGELARNVVDHAYTGDGLQARPRLLCVEADLGADARLRLGVADRGRWVEPTGGLGGRGIVLASGLVDDLRLRCTDAGTEVEVRQELRRPVLLYATGEGGGPSEGEGRTRPRPRDLHLGVHPGSVVADGHVDGDNVDVLASALVEATLAGSASAVVDLSGVQRLASAGVRCLALAERRCRRSGTRLQLVAAPGTPADRVLAALDIPHGRGWAEPPRGT